MATTDKKTPSKVNPKEQEVEHAHQKYRGLINGELAKQLYFLQNFRKEEDKLKHDNLRFKNGTKDMRKKLSASRKKRKKAQATLAATEESFAILSQDTEIGKLSVVIHVFFIFHFCNVKFDRPLGFS
jgi:septal ring factor EnvC (AmiA/AmiB activator)